MKESGLNYFSEVAGIQSGDFMVFYTFEEGAGTNLDSIPYGKSLFNATLSSEGTFWSKPGSGFFNGNYATVNNASGLQSVLFTHIFSFERTNTGEFKLLESLNGTSGLNFGLTSTNKLYFESYNEQPIVAASLNNLGSKNLVALSYAPNLINIGYYNFAAKEFEIESFTAPAGLIRSDIWEIGKDFNGYMDYYMYFSNFFSQNVLDNLASGLYNTPTGIGYELETVCSTGITGYLSIPVIQTGITGYAIIPSGAEGLGDFTGVFPTNNVRVNLTGILSSGNVLSGIVGEECITYTGAASVVFDVNTGYAASFGMDKVVMLDYVDTGDVVKWARSSLVFDNIYNQNSSPAYSGFILNESDNTGNLNLFLNGLAIANSGHYVTGIFLFITGANSFDIVTYDTAIGGKSIVIGPPYTFAYTGQEVFLNGLNMISGHDFTYNGTTITLIGTNTGINGIVHDYPVKLGFNTGNASIYSGARFTRDSSNVYLNGLRQKNKVDFIELSNYDMITGNSFNETSNLNVYNNNNLFWE